MNRLPIHPKTVAGAAGAGGGGAAAEFILWLLGVLVWGQPASADHAGDAVSAVPAPVSGLIMVVLAFVGAFIAAYRAPHTTAELAAAAAQDDDGPAGQHAAPELAPAQPDPLTEGG